MTTREEPAIDKSTRRLKAAIFRGIDIYLNNHSFGIGSLWAHGQTGKTRAVNLRRLVNNSGNSIDLTKIIIALLLSRGRTLAKYVSYCIFYGTVWPDFLQLITDDVDAEANSIIKYLTERNLYVVDKKIRDILF